MQDSSLVKEVATDAIATKTASLRAAFDERFRAPPGLAPEATIDLLIVQHGDGPVAIVVEDAARLVPKPRVAHVPDARSGCLGVAGHRGKLVAVFDLGQQLGHATRAVASTLIVSRRDATIGFLVGSIGRYARVPRSSVVAAADAGDRARIGMLAGGAPVLVVSLDELVVRILDAAKEGA